MEIRVININIHHVHNDENAKQYSDAVCMCVCMSLSIGPHTECTLDDWSHCRKARWRTQDEKRQKKTNKKQLHEDTDKGRRTKQLNNRVKAGS